MRKSKKPIRAAVAVLCYSIALAGVFYLIGYKTAYDRMENAASAWIPQTFYATIAGIQDTTFTVDGMEINDINFRGRLLFSAVEETKIMWRYTDIPIDDLDVGDHISVTFSGEILETDPRQIQQVDVIQLLDDER